MSISEGLACSVERGTKRYRNEKGELHRLDGPAVELPDGTHFWFRNGKLHRDDGPAILWWHGGQEWWLDGKMHRVCGPANERPNGERSWYLDGLPVTEDEAMSGQRKPKESVVPFRHSVAGLWRSRC